jgi:hypothetical protein
MREFPLPALGGERVRVRGELSRGGVLNVGNAAAARSRQIGSARGHSAHFPSIAASHMAVSVS